MSIRRDLALLASFSLVLLLVIAGVGGSQFRANFGSMHSLTNDAVPAALAAADLRADLKQLQLDLIEVVSAARSRPQPRMGEPLKARQDRLREGLSALQGASPSQAEEGLLLQAAESLDNYVAAMAETVAHGEAGRHALAEASLYANVAPYQQELQQILETLLIEKRRSKDESAAQMRDGLTRTLWFLGGAVVVSVLVLGGLMIRLYRNIIMPLRAMEATMARIADSLDSPSGSPSSVRTRSGRRYRPSTA